MSEAAWIDEALQLARQAAEEDEVPVGAIVVVHPETDRARIVGRGYNRREQDQQPGAHAEVLAIAEAAKALGSWRLHECWLIVTLEPCPMCLGASQQARIGKILYGATDPKGGALSLGYRLHEDPRTNHRFPVEHLEMPDSKVLLQTFFRSRRSKEKGEQA